jgi:hypothetical protein
MYRPKGIWNDGPQFVNLLDHEGAPPVVTRHICHAGADLSVGNLTDSSTPSDFLGPVVQTLQATTGPGAGDPFAGILPILQQVAEIAAPVVVGAFAPEALPFVLGGEAALNAGEGIVQQKPFGDIALGLGESAAGAALGGAFGDLGLGGASDFLGGGTDFLGGGGGAVAPGADAVTSGATGGLDASFGGAPVLTDTGILGTSPVMEPPGMGVPPAPAGVDVPAAGVGTATPGAAAGTGGAVSGITPQATTDPFGLGPTGGGAAPGVGGTDFAGLPTADSSVNIPQGDGGPPGSPAGPGGVNSGDPTAPGINDPLTQLAQAAPSGGGDIDSEIAQWIAQYGGGGSPSVASAVNASGVLDPNTFPSTSSIDRAIDPSLGTPPNSGVSANATPSSSGIGQFIKDNKDWLGPLLGVAGLGKQLLAPGLSIAPGQGRTSVAGLTAQQQALIDELAALRQSTLTPAAQQGSQALTKATSQAQQFADQLLSGKLTPEQSQLVSNNLAATLSTIKSRYGSLGQGTSTSEMEDEAAATAASVGGAGALQQQNTAQGIQLEQLASTDAQASVQELLTASGVQSNSTNTLLAQQEAQDAQLSQMIARLAAALSGAPPSFTVTPT